MTLNPKEESVPFEPDTVQREKGCDINPPVLINNRDLHEYVLDGFWNELNFDLGATIAPSWKTMAMEFDMLQYMVGQNLIPSTECLLNCSFSCKTADQMLSKY